MAADLGERADDGSRIADDTTMPQTAWRKRRCMTIADRLRIYRERQELSYRKAMEALREMDARADDFRRKQMEGRRRMLKEARTKEEEQRASVEERRKRLLEEEHQRRLLKLQKIWEINRRTEEMRRKRKKARGRRRSRSTGTVSDGAFSSGERTPVRPNRPHSASSSTGTRLPNYALPTVASTLRSVTWGTDPTLEGQLITVCFRCGIRAINIGLDRSNSRMRSRSAEPAYRSGFQSSYMLIFFDRSAQSRDVSPLPPSRPLSSRSSRPNASSSSAPPVFPPRPYSTPPFQKPVSRSPRKGTWKRNQTAKGRGGKEEEGEVEEEREQERKRKSSLLLLRKCPSPRQPHECSAEFRLLSFRHRDGVTSLAVAKGTKTPANQKKPNAETARPRDHLFRRSRARPEPRRADDVGAGEVTSGRRTQISRLDEQTTTTPRVAKETSGVAMRTTKQQNIPKRRPLVKHLINSDENTPSSRRPPAKANVARQRPGGNTANAKIERKQTTESRDTHDVTDDDDDVCRRDASDAGEQASGWMEDGRQVSGWMEDGANSETVSNDTSLDQFLDDSASLSETTTDDLDPVHQRGRGRSSGGAGGGRWTLLHLVPFSHLLRNREELEEGDEETIEIYEEYRILEEVEIRRGDETELIVTLEKIITEETIEIFCPDDLEVIHRGSVSSI